MLRREIFAMDSFRYSRLDVKDGIYLFPLIKGSKGLLKDIQWMARQEGKERLFYVLRFTHYVLLLPSLTTYTWSSAPPKSAS